MPQKLMPPSHLIANGALKCGRGIANLAFAAIAIAIAADHVTKSCRGSAAAAAASKMRHWQS